MLALLVAGVSDSPRDALAQTSVSQFLVVDGSDGPVAGHGRNFDAKCKAKGAQWRLADFRDLRAYQNNGGTLRSLISAFRWNLDTVPSSPAEFDPGNYYIAVSRNGNLASGSGRYRDLSGDRQYFVQYHNHNPPRNFAIFDYIRERAGGVTYQISLGSWFSGEGSWTVLCYSAGATEPPTPDPDEPSTIPNDRAILREFFRATVGSGWTNRENWGTARPLNDWHGVDAEIKHHHTSDRLVFIERVTKLELPDNGLTGRIPEAIGDLTELTFLDLSVNSLRGMLPVSEGELPKLHTLYLADSGLPDCIPQSIRESATVNDLMFIPLECDGDDGDGNPDTKDVPGFRRFIWWNFGEVRDSQVRAAQLGVEWVLDYAADNGVQPRGNDRLDIYVGDQDYVERKCDEDLDPSWLESVIAGLGCSMSGSTRGLAFRDDFFVRTDCQRVQEVNGQRVTWVEDCHLHEIVDTVIHETIHSLFQLRWVELRRDLSRGPAFVLEGMSTYFAAVVAGRNLPGRWQGENSDVLRANWFEERRDDWHNYPTPSTPNSHPSLLLHRNSHCKYSCFPLAVELLVSRTTFHQLVHYYGLLSNDDLSPFDQNFGMSESDFYDWWSDHVAAGFPRPPRQPEISTTFAAEQSLRAYGSDRIELKFVHSSIGEAGDAIDVSGYAQRSRQLLSEPFELSETFVSSQWIVPAEWSPWSDWRRLDVDLSTSGEKTVTLDGLQPGTVYQVELRAIQQVQTQPILTFTQATWAEGVQGAVVQELIAESGRGNVRLSFTHEPVSSDDPESQAFLEVSGYQIRHRVQPDDPDARWTEEWRDVEGLDLDETGVKSVLVDALMEETLYQFQIRPVTFGPFETTTLTQGTRLRLPRANSIVPTIREVSVRAGDSIRLEVDVHGLQDDLNNDLADATGSNMIFRWTESGAGGGAFGTPNSGRHVTYTAPDLPGVYTVQAEAQPDGICRGHHEDKVGVSEANRASCIATFTVRVSRAPGPVEPPVGPVNPSSVIPSSLTDSSGVAYTVFTPADGGTFTGDGVTVSAAKGAVPDRTLLGVSAMASSVSVPEPVPGTRMALAGSFYDVNGVQEDGGSPVSGYSLDDPLTICLPFPDEFRADLTNIVVVNRAADTGELAVHSSSIRQSEGVLSVCGSVGTLPATVAVARLGLVLPPSPTPAPAESAPDTGAPAPPSILAIVVAMVGALLLVAAAVSLVARRMRPADALDSG